MQTHSMSVRVEAALVQATADLIGKPFQWGGRGPKAYDCYGLIATVMQRCGVHVPDYQSSDKAECNAGTMLEAMAAGWERLDRPEIGCAVTFKMDRKDSTHVGVIVGADQFLHVMENTHVVRERLSSPLWKRRVTGFFRWIGA